MRPKVSLLTAALVGLAVVVGLLGVGGTWALWNAATESTPGTVQSATFDVKVNTQSIPADASNVSVDLEKDANGQTPTLTPSQTVYAAVTITNATNASGPFTVDATLGTPRPAGTTDARLSPYLILRTAPAPSGRCSSVTSGTYSAAAKSVQLAKGASARYCLEVALAANAPSTPGGTTVGAVLPLSVSQIPAGA